MSNIKEYNIDSPEGFLSLISHGGLLGKPENFLYRGQADALWGLKPSIFRHYDNCKLPISKLMFPDPTLDEIFQEWAFLHHFINYCSETNQLLPFDSEKLKNQHLSVDSLFTCLEHDPLWPPPETYQLMALVQHYKLPTRLLDWSKSPYVAAYFAASTALNTLLQDSIFSKKMAIWVLNIENINQYKELEIVEVPCTANKNMIAQEGCFTLLRQNPLVEQRLLLDEYFRNSIACPLTKITMPVIIAPVILKLCSKQGITGSKLFPDFYGVSQATLDTFNIAKIQTYLKELKEKHLEIN